MQYLINYQLDPKKAECGAIKFHTSFANRSMGELMLTLIQQSACLPF